MKNKVLSLILALLMAASSASAVLADEAIADVEETAVVEEVAEAGQYDKAIAFLANYGIFKGISADDLGADLDVNRYQMALFVGRISTGWVDDSKWEDGPENWSEFTDISEGAVADYWGALSYANQKGIIEGYGNGKFGPYDGITYQNALTMVVRTLGYTGLDWPWGYIQKAVELGLTDGITDVAYTDELTRGETAQIIYNAMFAKTKAGSTLGLENFGIEFGWEKIIVTASDLNTFVADKNGAALALKSDNITRYYKDSNKPDAGVVSFQILNDNGTLADDVYYVAQEALGLVGDHADELAVGDAYYVLFEKDEDSNLVNVVAYESLLTETLVNAGKTDDDKEEVDYAIEEFLDAHTLVNKYSSNAYVNMTKSGKPEVMVFTANSSTIEIVESTDYAIAIDWSSGDILVPVDADEDGDWKDDFKADGTCAFKLKYSWNTILEKYYEVKFDRDADDFGDVAINWISEKEMEKLLDDYKVETKKAVAGFNNAADSRLAKSAYAALDLFDTNLDGEADRGIYETYRLGYFENKQVDPGDCDCGKLDHFVVSDVNTIEKALAAYKAKEGKDATDIAAAKIEVREEGVKCKHSAARAWIVDDSVLVEDEETGYYEAAYVLYNYDAETGALNIVKNITEGVDEDSFVANGVVRAYNITKGTVVIGEETYKINNYAELLGNGFRYATDNTAAKAVYGALLESLFNQFVKYVVVDGELVHIEAVGATKSDLIIVDSYAGLSSDGYIVVNGYKASELKYDQFRIGSYDGWMKGDYYYYLDKETAKDSFDKGVMYSISSYDKENDLYNVSLAGDWATSRTQGDYYKVEDGVNLYETVIKETVDGYMDVTIDEKTTEVKMKSSDKYIIIPKAADENAPHNTLIVYTGKLGGGWTVSGDRINSNDPENRTYIIVNATVSGDFYANAYDTGLVLFLGGRINSADYNGNFAEDEYLLGAVEYEATFVDMFTGKEVTKYFTNKKLESGNIYYTMGDVVTEDKGTANGLDDVMAEIAHLYPETDGHAKYLVGGFTIDKETAPKFFKEVDLNGDDKKDADDAELWVGDEALITSIQDRGLDTGFRVFEGLRDLAGDAKYHKGLIADIKYYMVEYNEDGDEITAINETKWSKFEDLVEDLDDYVYEVYFVYTIDGDLVCYISEDFATEYDNGTGTVKTLNTSGLDTNVEDDVVITLQGSDRADAYIIADEIGYAYNTVDGVLSEAALTSISITWAGDYIDETTVHDADFKYSFGNVDAVPVYKYGANCGEGEANVKVTVDGVDVAIKSLAEAKYHTAADATCKLIKGFDLVLAEKEYIAVNDKVTVTVEIAAENGGVFSYSFDVEPVDSIIIYDELLEKNVEVTNKVIITK